MYYKRCTGAILVQKSTEMPEWVQWTHHSDGSGDVSFITGWMVLPNGKLKLNTPYGGK